MNEEQFDKKIRELIKETTGLPASEQEKLAPLIESTKKRHQEIKDSFGVVQKSLGDLRICIKYLVFDLEATRRENEELRTMLDNED
jgi:nitric oxide reductase activation protein